MWVDRKEAKKKLKIQWYDHNSQVIFTALLMNFSQWTWLTLLFSFIWIRYLLFGVLWVRYLGSLGDCTRWSGLDYNPFCLDSIEPILLNYCLFVRVEYRVWQYVWHVRLSTIPRDIRIWGSFYFREWNKRWHLVDDIKFKTESFFMATYNPCTSHVSSDAVENCKLTFCSHTECHFPMSHTKCHISNKID